MINFLLCWLALSVILTLLICRFFHVAKGGECVTEIYRAGYNDGRKEHDYDPQSHEITFELQCYIATLEAALTEAHRIILHELDNGRTPYLLPVDNGGKGLGYFEDVLAGIKR